MSRHVSPAVMDVLREARCEGPRLYLTGELDRRLYQQVAAVLKDAGGRWNRSAGATVFEGDALDAIDPILLTGTVQRTKQDFGQFDTPPELARLVVERAQIRPRMNVLEPSVGIGNLAREIAAKGGTVQAVEIDDKRRAAYDSLVLSPYRCASSDFLAIDPGRNGIFDRVVMNPPFARQADIAHVTHAARFLRPGGRLVAIMSAGVAFRQDRRATAFRELINQHGGSIEPLPPGSFRVSGTEVGTVLVSLNTEH